MYVEISVAMTYHTAKGDPALLAIEVAETQGQTVVRSALDVPKAKLKRVDSAFGVGQRIWAMGTGSLLTVTYSATVDVVREDVALETLGATPLHLLRAEALEYLRPSRFCQSDLFVDFVEQQFGGLRGGAKAAAILAWVHTQTSYVSGSSTSTTTATDTFFSRQGVCRDFAHLACSLLRAAHIPTRYVSGYGLHVQPPDFHAVVQVWLDGAWRIADATGMCLPSEFVVIATGRDAADVAFMETSLGAQCVAQEVAVAKSRQQNMSG